MKAEATIVKPFNILYVLTKAYAELMGFIFCPERASRLNMSNLIRARMCGASAFLCVFQISHGHWRIYEGYFL